MIKSILTIAMLVVFSGCSVVGPGEKGVRVTQGEVSDTVLQSGWYLWVPFITKVKRISVRIQKTETESEAATHDMQKVTAKLALNWHLDPAAVQKLYMTIGDEDDVVHQVINPAVSEVLKSSTAQMTAEEVLTKRIELKKTIDAALTTRLKTYNVIIDDVSLVNLNFTGEFNQAVEHKQIAEQRAKQSEYEAQQAIQQAKSAVNTARGEAESNLIKAKAQAESQKLLMQTLTPAVLQMEYLKHWNGVLPSVLTGNASGIMLNLNTKGTSNDAK